MNFHSTSATLASTINLLLDLINTSIRALSIIALLIFMLGGVRYIWGSSNKEGHGADKKLLIWGVVSMFVLFSLGGLVRLIEIAFLGGALN